MTIKDNLADKDICRTYVIYPPQHEDEVISDKIAHEWVKSAIVPLKGGCDHIIKYDHGKDFFTLLNIDHQSPPDENLTDKTLHYRLNDRLRATHVVILTPIDQKTSLQIKTTVFALSPYGPDSPRNLPVKLVMNQQQTATIHRINKRASYAKFLHLIPNSLGVGYFNNLGITNKRVLDGQVYEYSRHNNSVIPQIVSSITISNVRHPYGYALFDVSLVFFSASIISNDDITYVLTKIPPGVPFNPDTVDPSQRINYNLYSWLVGQVFGGELSFYTPIGTFFGSLGLGPGVNYTVDTIQNTQTAAVLLDRIAIGYRAFYNDHVYLQLTSGGTNVAYRQQVNNDYFTSNGSAFFSFTIGYYFPQVRSLARAAL